VIGLAVIAMASVTIYSLRLDLYFSVASASFNKEVKPSTDDAEAIEWIKANTIHQRCGLRSRTMYYLYTGRHADVLIAMDGNCVLEEKQKHHLDIVDQSNEVPFTDPKRLRGALPTDLKQTAPRI